jgi:endonuclease/exonuclease/phosphatase family metal-dependent hydrolase
VTRALIALAALPGCISIDDGPPPPWEPAAAVTGVLATELGPPPLAPPPPPSGTLRVASWNVEMGPDPAALADAIRASPVLATADVILVQEIEAYPDEPGTRTARIAGALGMTWIYAPARVQGDGTHGDAILSRFPLVDPSVKRLPYVDQPVNAQPRIAVRAAIDLGASAGAGEPFVVVGVHLDVRLGPVDRVRQLDPAVSDNPERVVVGGDFNSNPWAWVETLVPLTGTEAIVGHDQAAILDDYFAALGFATPISADADTHTAPIDMRLDALYARGYAVTGAGVDDAGGSDHYPVWIDVALP